jgi:hypothetical protein
MQHVNIVADRGQVDNPVSAGRLTYPDLANTGTDGWHGFPVRRIFADLNLKQLISSFASRVVRKGSTSDRLLPCHLTSFII